MLLEGLNTRLKKEEIVSELQRATEIIQSEKQKNRNNFRTIWDSIKLSSINIIKIPEKEEKKETE